MLKATLAVVLLAASATLAQTPTDAQRCERVARLDLAHTELVARLVPAGGFPPPGERPDPAIVERFRTTPQFCRVTAHAHPSSDSDIVVEIWLPAEAWNGRFQALGGGGFAGVIPYPTLATVVKRGYAVAATDTGHTTGANAEWAFGHPEKVVDFGYRAIHQMTVIGKAAVGAFYGKNAEHSYFLGCSTGGRQALMEAQRFPDDYDGILAGAPANYWTRLLTSAVWAMQSLGNDAESYIPAAKWKAVEAAVNNACDANDGVKDGILNDPRQCRFDPAVLACKAGDNDSCLTAKQVVALKKMYGGPRDSHGRSVFFGLLPGAESRQTGWESWVSGESLGKSSGFFFGKEYFSNMVFQDKNWDYHTASVEAALKAADRRTGPVLNATSPDLSRLAKHGGKLILYHGWNDPAIPALGTVDYFESVQKKMGRTAAEKFLRLYMVPGMQHCGSGPGATAIGGNVAPFEPDRNILSALEQWVEKGVAPSTIVASKPGSAMTRPLCPYPQSARFEGGDPNVASSFACVKP